jgi:hypothetical protein
MHELESRIMLGNDANEWVRQMPNNENRATAHSAQIDSLRRNIKARSWNPIMSLEL